jgi:HSP20 family protein
MALRDWAWNWDPWREAGRLSSLLGGGLRLAGHRRAYPPVNVYESADAYGLEVELPGVDPAKLELTVEGDLVTVSGQRPAGKAEGSFHRRERFGGGFSRTLRLPTALEAAGVEAHYRDGILSARLPKAVQARARKIAVRAG